MVASVNFSSTARVDFQTGVPTFLVPVSHWVLRRSTADGLGTFWGIRKGRPKRPHLCRWTLRRVNVLGCWTLIWFLYMQFVFWLVCVGPGRGAGGRGGGLSNYHWRVESTKLRVILLSWVLVLQKKTISASWDDYYIFTLLRATVKLFGLIRMPSPHYHTSKYRRRRR